MNIGPLANKTVLELGSMIAAPFATHILSQMGATVIKIEPPAGETTRSLVRGGPSGTYIAYNRGKKSLCLNLQTEEGQEIFRQLVASADIVVHNLSPGAARRLNISYEKCAELNPHIVYCHIKGFGKGPQQEDIASNPIAEAATGVMYGNRIDGRPSRMGPSYHDQFAGSYAVMGILAALLSPPGSKNRNIEFGLYETGLHIAARDLVGVQLKSQLLGRPEQEPSPEFSMPGYGSYETKDGRWVYLVMLTDMHWQKFCEAAQIPPNPDLASLRQRRKQRPEVEDLVKSAVGQYGYDELAKTLTAAGVGFTEVLSLDRVLEAPQAEVAGKYSEFSFKGYDFRSPNFPVEACAGEAEPDLTAPLLGEHSTEVLRRLGYNEAQVDTLLGQGVAVDSDPNAQLWAKVDPSKKPLD